MHVITLLLIEWEFISIINCTCYSVTYMGTRPLNKGTNRPITLCTVKLFIQLMYNKNDHLAKWSIFCQIFDVFFRLYNPFAPLDPRRPLHMLCICIATFNCPKGILGLGGKASKNKLKDASFIFSMTNVTILSVFRTHAQRKNRKVSKMKGTYILNILALLLFENLQRIY